MNGWPCYSVRPFLAVIAIASTLALACAAVAEEPVDYLKQIKPLLQSRCYACHGALKQEAGLRLDTAKLIAKGSENGPVMSPGKGDVGPLLKRIASTDLDERMPPEGESLTAPQVTALRTWIAQGAIAPSDEQPERDPRDHWAFRAPVRPAIPKVADARWNRNPIDAFVFAEYEKRGLKPQPPADKRVWLRRASLDLIGLPPTAIEQAAFLADESPEAMNKVVDRLLSSREYAERWGRHWMDIWRYSDWWGLGAEVRNSQKHIWHWRDWIIDSLHADKGYDQMLREMLAADELYPNDLDRLRASGFLARQYFRFNRTSWMDETVEHTSKAMLGLTFNCCKCHDHKYDPLGHTDYYRLRAFFEPYQVRTDLLPGSTSAEQDGLPRAFDCNLNAVTYRHLRGDDRNPDKSRELTPGIPGFLSFGELKITPIDLPIEAWQPALRPFVLEDRLKVNERKIAEARAALELAKEQLVDAEKRAAVPAASDKPAGLPDAPSKLASKSLVKDDFSKSRPDLWEMKGGKWSYENGHLRQSQTGAMRVALRLKQLPPGDFDVRLKYVTTGGDMWKSVGINFDVVEQNEVLAYLSSVASGPKAQVAYKTGADYIYPADSAQARAVPLNEPQELQLQVRGRLLNLWHNGEMVVAWRLPIERKHGAMEVIAFDAQVNLLSFELAELPVTVSLAESASPKVATTPSQPTTIEQARLKVTLAEKSIELAIANLLSMRARGAADLAKAQSPAPADLAAKVAAAVRAGRLVAAAFAEEEVVRADLALSRTAKEKKAEAEKGLAAARQAAEAAKKAIDSPGGNYTSLIGAAKTPESNLESAESLLKPFPKTSTGRRTALAAWITDRKNPLAARVAVNHLWGRHFGKPLVTTVFDFGRKGAAPSHPELLDYLAVELMEHGWSMKHIHRLIVTSEVYRLSSSSAGAAEANLAKDPENRGLWKRDPIRMEAQVVRDSLLHLAGELDTTRGGPSIAINDEASRRRSLYFVHSHNDHQKFLSIFDDAGVLECYRRSESIVPQQALALENSPLALAMAEKIAKRMEAEHPVEREFVAAAYRLILADEPSDDELSVLLGALVEWKKAGEKKGRADPIGHARVLLVHALLNHNDFVTIR